MSESTESGLRRILRWAMQAKTQCPWEAGGSGSARWFWCIWCNWTTKSSADPVLPNDDQLEEHRPDCKWRRAMEASVEPSKLAPVPYAEPPDHIGDAGEKVEAEIAALPKWRPTNIPTSRHDQPGKEAAPPAALDLAGIRARLDAARTYISLEHYPRRLVFDDVPALLAEVERLGELGGALRYEYGMRIAGLEDDIAVQAATISDQAATIELLHAEMDTAYGKECDRIIDWQAKIDEQAATIEGLEKALRENCDERDKWFNRAMKLLDRNAPPPGSGT